MNGDDLKNSMDPACPAADESPRIVRSLITPVVVMAVVWIVDGVIMLQSRNRWAGAGLALFGVFLGLRSIRDYSTTVAATGVTQLTIRGRLTLNWVDITRIAREPQSIILTGTHGRVVVPIQSFSDTNETVSYIYSRLPPNLKVASNAADPSA